MNEKIKSEILDVKSEQEDFVYGEGDISDLDCHNKVSFLFCLTTLNFCIQAYGMFLHT